MAEVDENPHPRPIRDADIALCAHVLGGIHFACGGEAAGLDGVTQFAGALAKSVEAARSVMDFVERLADIADDVTDRKIVTKYIDTSQHSVCALLEDALVYSITSLVHGSNACVPVWMHNFKLRAASPRPFTVDDVVSLAGSLHGVIETPLSSIPVCVDATGAQFLKKVTALSYATQYFEKYRKTLVQIEKHAQELVVSTAPEDDYYKFAFNASDTLLWACLKLDVEQILQMAQNIQSSESEWTVSVVDRAYQIFGIAHIPDTPTVPSVVTDYMIGTLEMYIHDRYGEAKLCNPTNDQKKPFMYLMMFYMRMRRARWEKHMFHVSEALIPRDWKSAPDVLPHTLSELTQIHPRGIFVFESARVKTTRLIVARADDDPLIYDATCSVVESVAKCTANLSPMLWRARPIRLLPLAASQAAREKTTLCQMFTESGIRFLPTRGVAPHDDTHMDDVVEIDYGGMSEPETDDDTMVITI